MNVDMIMLVFDVIILIYGIHCIHGAYQMKRTGVPNTLFITEEELQKLERKQDFCNQIIVPTRIFGSIACLYAILELSNQYIWKEKVIRIGAVICFALAYFWYMIKLNRAKRTCLPDDE